MKVLVVDDHKVNRMLPRAILSKLGIEVLEADSGEAALECLARTPEVDHVLLDVSMPGMTGIEVCQRLREEERTRGLHIIAYTAHAFASEKNQITLAAIAPAAKSQRCSPWVAPTEPSRKTVSR